MSTDDQLVSFLDYQRGWDGYKAPPISGLAVRAAQKWVAFLRHFGVPEPAVVPTLGGGVQLEWHRSGVDVEIEFNDEGHWCVFAADCKWTRRP